MKFIIDSKKTQRPITIEDLKEEIQQIKKQIDQLK